MFLFETLRLNDNRLYDTSVNLQSCNLADVPNFCRCVFLRKQFWYGLKGGGHNVFKAANLPTNWLKIPKSVIVTDFPFLSSYLSTYCTWLKYIVTPEMMFRSMGVPGRDPVILLWAWWVSLALSRSL